MLCLTGMAWALLFQTEDGFGMSVLWAEPAFSSCIKFWILSCPFRSHNKRSFPCQGGLDSERNSRCSLKPRPLSLDSDEAQAMMSYPYCPREPHVGPQDG